MLCHDQFAQHTPACGAPRGPGIVTPVAAYLLPVAVVDVVEDSPHQVPAFLVGEYFGQKIRPVLQSGYVCGEALFHCYCLTHKVVADAV